MDLVGQGRAGLNGGRVAPGSAGAMAEEDSAEPVPVRSVVSWSYQVCWTSKDTEPVVPGGFDQGGVRNSGLAMAENETTDPLGGRSQ